MKSALTLALLFVGIIACQATVFDNTTFEYYANRTCYHSSRVALIVSKLASDPIQLNNITFPGTLITNGIDLVCNASPISSFVDDDDNDNAERTLSFWAQARNDFLQKHRDWIRRSFGLGKPFNLRGFFDKLKWKRVAPHSIGGYGKWLRRKRTSIFGSSNSFLEMTNPPSDDMIPLEWYQNGSYFIADGSERVDTLDARNLTAHDVRVVVAFSTMFIDDLLHTACGNDGYCASARTNAQHICRNRIRPHWGPSSYADPFGSPDNITKRFDFLNGIDSLWTGLQYMSPYAGRCD